MISSGVNVMRRWFAAGVVVLMCLLWVVEAHAGYRGPFEGRVIDADTREPIQGAVVFVEWKRKVMTPVEAQTVYHDAAEVLTDEKGEFYIKKKWSWSPWRNLMMYASVLIFKAGYGHVDIADWPRLNTVAEYMKSRTPEERKKVGPEFYFNIEFEDGQPLFLLKKLTTLEERMNNRLGLDPGSEIPNDKKRLLIQRIRGQIFTFDFTQAIT
jgi:hypothetical protein